MINTIINNTSLNSGWELIGGQRRAFDYTGDNITTINFKKLIGNEWVTVFKQELTYDGSGNLLTITGIKL